MPDTIAIPRGVLGGKIAFTAAFYGTLNAEDTVDSDNYATTNKPDVRILDSNGASIAGPYNLVSTPAVTRVSQGNYSFTFTIPAGWVAADTYKVQWELVIDSNVSRFEQQFAIEAASIDITQYGYSGVTGHTKTLITDFLYPFLGEAMDLEVHSEIAQKLTYSSLRFNHPHWRRDWTPILYKNEKSLLTYETDYSINFDVGTVDLSNAIIAGDEVSASYRFQYFTIDELASYLELTLRGLNGIKPASSYSMDDAPMEWDEVIVLGAKLKAMERMLFDRQIWRDMLIWSDALGAKETLQGLYNSMKSDYSLLTSARYFKRRGAVRPYGVSSGKYYTPQLATNINFRNYTILGAGF